MGMTARAMGAWTGLFALVALYGAGCGSSDSKGAGGGGTCWPSDPSCKLPSGAGFECLSLYDNGVGDKGTYRMRQLQVQKPPLLAGEFLQKTVVSKAITLNMAQCLQDGTGRFSWLFDVDWAAGIAKTGGGHVQLDPWAGYCWIDQDIGSFHAQPMEVELEVGQDGEYRTFRTKASIPILNVPIFLDDAETSSILMPLHEVDLLDGKVAPDNNCIGSWDGDGLSYDNNCMPDKTIGQTMQWLNGARLTGYITAEEADAVWIPEMQQSLCVALSGDGTKYGEPDETRGGTKCKRDSNGRLAATEKADWCSSTNAACDPCPADQTCATEAADSFRLEGMFAASAVKLNETCP